MELAVPSFVFTVSTIFFTSMPIGIGWSIHRGEKMKTSDQKPSRLLARHRAGAFLSTMILLAVSVAAQQGSKVEQVELQPLTAQVSRLIETMDYLGAPINRADRD